MRKLTLELEPYEMIREELKPMFEIIHSCEILETLKTNWEEGTTVQLIEFHFRETRSIHEVGSIGNMEILSVLKSEGDKHTCLVKYVDPEESRDLFKKFDLDLISTTPYFLSDIKHIYSVIGDNESLAKCIELVKKGLGTIERMTFKNAAYQRHDILSTLTDRQREVLITAHKYGYYDYPKKINSARLSDRVGLSRSTLLGHLRKAEGRILNDILTGYSGQ